VEVWQTSNLRRLRLGEEKKIDRKKKKKPQTFITAICEQEDMPIRSVVSNIGGFIIMRRVS